MNFLKVTTLKSFLIYIGVLLALTLTALLFFFYVYLPNITKHGETVTVPNLEGIHLDAIDEFLTNRNLHYEVTADSGFSEEYAPLTILKQYPLPGSKVKEDRKIYLSVNATTPPQVKMPRLIDGSVKNAQLVLKSYGLERGNIRYKPDLAQNAVLEQEYKGKPIEPGTQIPKGAKIDLIVGDGYGNREFETPDLSGMDFEEAEILAVGSGLKMGSILYKNPAYAQKKPADIEATGTQLIIYKQNPPAGKNIRIGEEVDIWLEELSDQQETILDEAEEESTDN